MAAVKVLAPPLDAISAQAREYPAYLLPHRGTGLCLFAAAFLGHNDAIHMARAEMELDLVDTDRARLVHMGLLYDGARVWHQDAWEFAEAMRGQADPWDVVSVDTFTGDAERRSLDSLELWCSLARAVVTVTHSSGSGYVVPDGWEAVLFPRSEFVNWLVLTHA